MQLEALKNEIGTILGRYQIPMEDKTFILEKIEGEIGGLAGKVATHVKTEREKDFAQMSAYEKKAKEAVALTVRRAEEAVKKAYQMGFQEGLGQTKNGSQMSWTTILLTVGLLGLGGFVIFREYFGSRERDSRR